MSTKTIEQFFKRAILLALVAKGWLSLPPFEPEHFAELYRLTDEKIAVVDNDGDVQIETLDGTIFIAADDAAGFDEWLTGRKRHSRCRWRARSRGSGNCIRTTEPGWWRSLSSRSDLQSSRPS